MEEFQITILLLDNGLEIKSKWLSGEEDNKTIMAVISEPSSIKSFQFLDGNDDIIVIMEQPLKNSILKIKRRTA